VNNAGEFMPYTLKQLARFASIGFKRACRQMADYAAQGYLVVEQRAKATMEGYKGLPAIRKVTFHLFRALEMEYALVKREQEAAFKRHELKYTKAQFAKLKPVLRAFAKQPSKQAEINRNKSQSEIAWKAWTAKVLEFHAQGYEMEDAKRLAGQAPPSK
jgi:hypothetical protein